MIKLWKMLRDKKNLFTTEAECKTHVVVCVNMAGWLTDEIPAAVETMRLL